MLTITALAFIICTGGTKSPEKSQNGTISKGVEEMAVSGTFIHNLDEKNRFKVPSKLRERLGTELHLMKSPDSQVQCIYVYSESEWDNVCKELHDKVGNNLEGRRKARLVISRAVSGDVDKNGRFTLNTALKEYAGIEDEVCIVCNINHIELWSPEAWRLENEILDDTSLDDLDISF